MSSKNKQQNSQDFAPGITINGSNVKEEYLVTATEYSSYSSPPSDMSTSSLLVVNTEGPSFDEYEREGGRFHSEGNNMERKRRSLSADVVRGSSSVGRSRSVSPKRDASSSPSGHTKRGWESWTLEEMDSFFTGISNFGRDFEEITVLVRTKNYDQVSSFPC